MDLALHTYFTPEERASLAISTVAEAWEEYTLALAAAIHANDHEEAKVNQQLIDTNDALKSSVAFAQQHLQVDTSSSQPDHEHAAEDAASQTSASQPEAVFQPLLDLQTQLAAEAMHSAAEAVTSSQLLDHSQRTRVVAAAMRWTGSLAAPPRVLADTPVPLGFDLPTPMPNHLRASLFARGQLKPSQLPSLADEHGMPTRLPPAPAVPSFRAAHHAEEWFGVSTSGVVEHSAVSTCTYAGNSGLQLVASRIGQAAGRAATRAAASAHTQTSHNDRAGTPSLADVVDPQQLLKDMFEQLQQLGWTRESTSLPAGGAAVVEQVLEQRAYLPAEIVRTLSSLVPVRRAARTIASMAQHTAARPRAAQPSAARKKQAFADDSSDSGVVDDDASLGGYSETSEEKAEFSGSESSGSAGSFEVLSDVEFNGDEDDDESDFE